VLTDVVKALADVDPHTPVVEALLAAHSSVLSDVIDGTGPVTLQRMKSGFSAVRRPLCSESSPREHNAQNIKIAGCAACAHKRATGLSRP
jgi:hypothetical protein